MTTWQVADNMKKQYIPGWGTRVLMAGFIFLLGKGLLWLILLLVFYGIR